MARYWTCRRQTNGKVCLWKNKGVQQKCQLCGGARPKRRQQKHMASLVVTYEDYIELNGGEHCGICGITREQTKDPSRRLDRDHGHDVFGKPRGLLCRPCNRKLRHWLSAEWMRAAADYLDRAADR